MPWHSASRPPHSWLLPWLIPTPPIYASTGSHFVAVLPDREDWGAFGLPRRLLPKSLGLFAYTLEDRFGHVLRKILRQLRRHCGEGWRRPIEQPGQDVLGAHTPATACCGGVEMSTQDGGQFIVCVRRTHLESRAVIEDRPHEGDRGDDGTIDRWRAP